MFFDPCRRSCPGCVCLAASSFFTNKRSGLENINLNSTGYVRDRSSWKGEHRSRPAVSESGARVHRRSSEVERTFPHEGAWSRVSPSPGRGIVSKAPAFDSFAFILSWILSPRISCCCREPNWLFCGRGRSVPEGGGVGMIRPEGGAHYVDPKCGREGCLGYERERNCESDI